ncbi:fructosamine kinase family protein [Flavimarina sp. Hel_I_48]|uniref:fructosamine kinase family protein n=1 Tax=Flavimarina sp. Hel_I_48 TaxID=1392488 RepID=UPI0004DF4867|nr:fructosamine kinase family protein [Flavimarina sp. Hel_I_48]
MLEPDFLNELSQKLDSKIISHKPLSGGDINEVYTLESENEKWVIKVNNAQRFPGMFEKEAAGLQALREPHIIDVPKVITSGEHQNQSYLLLEHKATGTKKQEFWTIFGRQLAKLHQQSAAKFGFEEDNYIGSLPQYNEAEDNAAEFYINQRLKPQFALALENGYKFTEIDRFYDKIRHLIPQEKPALIHGDLWSGNFLVNASGDPCLIDPATAFAPREMDIGLMHLFGGFNPSLFDAYNSEFPLAHGWPERIKLWQLYYVLVHVNLFGGGYFASAEAILRHYLNS